jgi:hypothetical protein
MSTGVKLIELERERQITVEGFDAEQDKGRTEELLAAAVAYILNARSDVQVIAYDGSGTLPEWREALDEIGWPWAPKHWKPTNMKRDLEKAGALIAAALDSLGTD